MKTLTRLEDLGFLLLAIYLFTTLDFPWWLYPLIFFLPDLSLLGLLFGPKSGAVAYNLTHHRLAQSSCLFSAVCCICPCWPWPALPCSVTPASIGL